jgi:hypothetical protein
MPDVYTDIVTVNEAAIERLRLLASIGFDALSAAIVSERGGCPRWLCMSYGMLPQRVSQIAIHACGGTVCAGGVCERAEATLLALNVASALVAGIMTPRLVQAQYGVQLNL